MLAFADIIVYHVRILGKRGGFISPGGREREEKEKETGWEKKRGRTLLCYTEESFSHIHAARGGR